MMGAPPNTSGITYTGRPPDLNAQMMHAAPAAPSAPAIVAVTRPVPSKFDSDPCDPSAATGMSTPIRKYATPTQSSAFNGLPSCVCPMWSSAPYAPHDKTAPATKTTHPIDFLVCCAVRTVVIDVSGSNAPIVAQASLPMARLRFCAPREHELICLVPRRGL